MVNRAIRGYRVGMNPSPPTNYVPSDFVLEAMAAWKERMDKSNLTPAEQQQATKVLIKLMTIQQKKAQARGQ